MAMTSSQVKQQQNNMAGTGTGWPRRNSQNSNSSTTAATSSFEQSKFPTPSTALNRIINL